MNKTIQSLEPQLKIIDKKSNKHFGILLITQQCLEDFQLKCNMKKEFVSEYQFHYWALVARVKLNDEVLNIAIPTVLFNYKQEVSQATVTFHLKDVEAESNANIDLANSCADTLIKSDFCNYLISVFPNIEWMNVPMNTCHVHPGTLSSFSGTDYSKNVNDPGIVFPLANPLNQPSFSSILCHDTKNQNIVKMVRTEYRNANKVDNNIIYEHGTCLAYIRDNRLMEYPLIQALFTLKQSDILPSYINKDGIVVLENNDLLNNIIKEFDKMTEWNPYTTDVQVDRIIKKQNINNSYTNSYTNLYGKQMHQGQSYLKYWNDDNDEDFMTLTDYRNEIVKSKAMSYKKVYELSLQEAKIFYESLKHVDNKLKDVYTNIVSNLGYESIKEKLITFRLKEAEVLTMSLPLMKDKLVECLINENIELNKKKQQQDTELSDYNEKITPDEMIKYLLANDFKIDDIKGKSMAELEFMFETIFENEQDDVEAKNAFNPHSYEFIN